MIYHLDLTYHCADDGQAERIGVAMAEFIRAEFQVTGYGISRVVPIGPPATQCTCVRPFFTHGGGATCATCRLPVVSPYTPAEIEAALEAAGLPRAPLTPRANTGDEGEGT